MAITHHPDISSLMSCAAGSQPEAMAAVVSSHLSVCSECRREVGRMQQIGVALFDKLAASPVAAAAPVVAARASEADDDSEPAKVAAARDVPHPLAAVVDGDLDQLQWKRLAPGVWHYPIGLSEGAMGDLRLLKVSPGTRLPDHGHSGTEMTMVLRGSYTDALGTYRAGDVADLDGDAEHAPIACEKEGCICLVATEGPVRFKGLFARLIQPIVGL